MTLMNFICSKVCSRLGYKELNWNLGCPYPMVTKSGMGSGLEYRKNQSYSRKSTHGIRCPINENAIGYESPQEIIDVLPILDKYPLKNIAIHARLGKQLYKGGVDLDGFQNDTTKHKLYYNGDITSVAKF
jgi:tRNA-dihydrouridine synthase